MGWFSFQRNEGFPTHYSDQHSPAHVDVLTSGLILSLVILGVSLLSLLPSFTGKRRFIFFTHVTVSLIIGGIIIISNFGDSWESAHVKIRSPYKAGSSYEITAKLGLHIGLRGFNITLLEIDKHKSQIPETIDYNEHFSWEGSQGRFGFGKYSARVARDFREAVYRGTPIPILQLAEYFTFDGEGIRFGRHYRLAGYYTYIMMWIAFTCWIIANILLIVVLQNGAIWLIFTGVFQLIGIGIWTFNRNFIELEVPFESSSGKSEVVLHTKFSRDYYAVLLNGSFCLLVGIILYFANIMRPDEMCELFGIDPLTLYDECHLSKEEIEEENTLELNRERDVEDQDVTIRRRSKEQIQESILKRKTDFASRLFHDSFSDGKSKKKPTITPRRKNKMDLNVTERSTEMTPLLKENTQSNSNSSEYVNEIIYTAKPISRTKRKGGTESLADFPPPPPIVPPKKN